MREELHLDAGKFTTLRALARELRALLGVTSYKFVVEVSEACADQLLEELAVELEDVQDMGRIKVRRVEPKGETLCRS